MRSALPPVTIVAAFVALIVGCKSDYPACETDKDCHQKESCVDRKCQQCREAGDCGPSETCVGGKCSPLLASCQTNGECPEGQVCVDHRCRRCSSDSHCPPPTVCHEGTCTSAKRCVSRFDCTEGDDCVGGLCKPAQSKRAEPCPLPSVHFDFNEAILTIEATGRLADAVDCLRSGPTPIRAVGHADPRGTQEYNLALSERRARAVREHLHRLGIDPGQVNLLPRGSLDASGMDEAGWAKDRRVDLTWQ